MLIYSITNVVNDKMYIGQTTKTLEDRIKTHRNSMTTGKDTHLYRAMRKYGWDKFVFKVIAYAETKEILDELEIYYIQKFDTIRNGYNMAKGGSTNCMVSEVVAKKHDEKMRTPEVREKISKSMKLSYEMRGGVSEEHRRHLSENKKAFYASERGRIAREKFSKTFKLTPEHQAKILAAKRKKVACYSADGEFVAEFPSVRDAAKWINETQGKNYNLKSLCGRIKRSNDQHMVIGGYRWEYRV